MLVVAFVACFLLPMSAAIEGPQEFDRVAAAMARIPFGEAAAFLLVLFPILVHLVGGLWLLSMSRLTVVACGNYRNWMYALERLTGALLVPPLLYYLVKARLPFAFSDGIADFAFYRSFFAPGWVRALSLLGVVCLAFHLGHGVTTAFAQWGVTASRRAQNFAAMIMWVVTLVVGVWGVRVICAFF